MASNNNTAANEVIPLFSIITLSNRLQKIKHRAVIIIQHLTIRINNKKGKTIKLRL